MKMWAYATVAAARWTTASSSAGGSPCTGSMVTPPTGTPITLAAEASRLVRLTAVPFLACAAQWHVRDRSNY